MTEKEAAKNWGGQKRPRKNKARHSKIIKKHVFFSIKAKKGKIKIRRD